MATVQPPPLGPRLIATDALESTIAELMTVVRAQSAEIAQLKMTVHRLEAAAAPAGTMDRVLATLENLDGRLVACSRAITLPNRCSGQDEADAGGQPAVGSVVCAHERRLALLEKRACGDDSAAGHDDSLVSARVLREKLSELETKASAAVAKLSEGCASRAAVAALQRAVEGQLSQTAAVQALLGTKVDRSELSRLEAIAADYHSFDTWKDAVNSDVKELYSRAEAARKSVDAALESLSKLGGVVQAVSDGLRTKVEESRLSSFTSRFADVDALISTKADAEACAAALKETEAKLSRSIREVATKAEARATQLSAGLDNAAVEVGAARAGAAAALQSACSELRGELASLSLEVGRRAYISSLEATDDSLQSLAESIRQLSLRTDVCLRFIQWYSDKGEAYEFNAQGLERHMNALAVGNRSKVVGGVGLAGVSGGGGGPLTGTAGVRIGGVAAASGSAPAAASPSASSSAVGAAAATVMGSPSASPPLN